MSVPRPDKLPEWASVPQNDPNKPVPNIVEPPSGKKQLGWIFEEFPPSNWFNWLLNKIYKWLEYFDDQHVNVGPIYGIDTGVTPNQVEVTLVPPISDYKEGRLFLIKIANTNTGGSTLEIDSKGAWPILDLDGNSLVGGEIVQDVIYMFVFSEGTAPGEEHFILQSKPDAVASMITGDWIFTSRGDTRPGCILYNADGTIGSDTSGASILASDTAERLFKHLWNTYPDSVCPVDGGRGGSADADWTANKRIHVLPVWDRVFASRGGHGLAQTEGQWYVNLDISMIPGHNHSPIVVPGRGDFGVGTKDFSASGGTFFGLGSPLIEPAYNGGSGNHYNMQPTIYFNVLMKL